jgi:hypothetical protein
MRKRAAYVIRLQHGARRATSRSDEGADENMHTGPSVLAAMRTGFILVLAAWAAGLPVARAEGPSAPAPAGGWVETPAVAPLTPEEHASVSARRRAGAGLQAGALLGAAGPVGRAVAQRESRVAVGAELAGLGVALFTAAAGVVAAGALLGGLGAAWWWGVVPHAQGLGGAASSVVALGVASGVALALVGAGVLWGALWGQAVRARLWRRHAPPEPAEVAPPAQEPRVVGAQVAAGVLAEHSDVAWIPLLGPAMAASRVEMLLAPQLLLARQWSGLPRVRDTLGQKAARWVRVHAVAMTVGMLGLPLLALASASVAALWVAAAWMGGPLWLVLPAVALTGVPLAVGTAGLAGVAAAAAVETALPWGLATDAVQTRSAEGAPPAARPAPRRIVVPAAPRPAGSP